MVTVSIMSKNLLRNALEYAWVGATAQGEWTSKCPSLNQCAVTALVIQDYFGGDLLRCECDDGGSHYWNMLPGGEDVDWTEQQFEYSGVTPIRETVVIRDRDYVLSPKSTKRRYKVLLKRVKAYLEEHEND